jgi:hypothetical protein
VQLGGKRNVVWPDIHRSAVRVRVPAAQLGQLTVTDRLLGGGSSLDDELRWNQCAPPHALSTPVCVRFRSRLITQRQGSGIRPAGERRSCQAPIHPGAGDRRREAVDPERSVGPTRRTGGPGESAQLLGNRVLNSPVRACPSNRSVLALSAPDGGDRQHD